MKKHAKNAPTQAPVASYEHTQDSTHTYRVISIAVALTAVVVGLAVTGTLGAMYHLEGYGLHPLAGLLIAVVLLISGAVLVMGIATIHIDDYPTE